MKYEVLNVVKFGVFEVNVYYIYIVWVIKFGSGYNVILMVKVKSGIVFFMLFFVGVGLIVNIIKMSSGGDDIWIYIFYVVDLIVLDNLVVVLIWMSVLIVNIFN